MTNKLTHAQFCVQSLKQLDNQEITSLGSPIYRQSTSLKADELSELLISTPKQSYLIGAEIS